jgi:hypothetical protein
MDTSNKPDKYEILLVEQTIELLSIKEDMKKVVTLLQQQTEVLKELSSTNKQLSSVISSLVKPCCTVKSLI